MAKKIKMELSVKDKGTKSVNKFTSNVVSSMKKLAGPVAIGAVAAGFVTLARRTVDYGDKLHKLNIKLGVSVNEFDKLKQVAELSGVTFETLAMAMQRMTRRVVDAGKGAGPAAKAIKQLGMNTDDLIKLSPDEQFKKIAEQLAKVENQSQRVSLAFALFDSEGVSVLQMVDDLEEKLKETSSTMDQKTVTSFATFNDNMTKAYENLKQSLIPSLAALADAFNTAYDSAQGKSFGLKGKAIKEGFKKFPMLLDHDKSQEEMIQYNKMRVAWIEMRYGQLKTTKETSKKNINLVTNDTKKIIEVSKEQQDAIRASIKAGNDAEVDMWRKKHVDIYDEKYRFIQAIGQLEEDELNQAIEDGANAEVDMWRKKHVDIEAETYRFYQAIGELEEEAQKKQAELEEKRRLEIEKTATYLSDNFADAFMDFVQGTKTAQDAFKEMVSSILADLARMYTQKALMGLFTSLIGGFAGSAGGGSAAGATTLSNGATINSSGVVFGMANGGVLTGGFQSFANGGRVSSPTLGLVGEGRYNEAVVPLPDGNRIPVEMKGGGNDISISNTFNFSGQQGGNEQEKKALGKMISGQIKEQIKMVIKDEKRFGGVLNRQYQGAA